MLTPELTRIRLIEAENSRLKSENIELNQKLNGARECVIKLLKSIHPYCDYAVKIKGNYI